MRASPVVSYPYEWSFGMLRDAALLQLDLTLAALDEGMTLKDATPFNVRCFRHELLLSRPYLLLTKALRQDFHNRRSRQLQNRL